MDADKVVDSPDPSNADIDIDIDIDNDDEDLPAQSPLRGGARAARQLQEATGWHRQLPHPAARGLDHHRSVHRRLPRSARDRPAAARRDHPSPPGLQPWFNE